MRASVVHVTVLPLGDLGFESGLLWLFHSGMVSTLDCESTPLILGQVLYFIFVRTLLKKKSLFIWLHWVLFMAHRIFIASCRSFC